MSVLYAQFEIRFMKSCIRCKFLQDIYASVNSKHQHPPPPTGVLHSTAAPGRDLYLMTFPGGRVFAYP